MSLLDDLRAAAAHVDPQFQVTSNEVPGVLSALIAYQEHGDEFLKASQDENATTAVTDLLQPPPADQPTDAAVAPAAPGAPASAAPPAEPHTATDPAPPVDQLPAPPDVTRTSTPVPGPAVPDPVAGEVSAAAETPTAAAPPGELSDEELDAVISDLEAQRAARRATEQQTTVTHETGIGDIPPAPGEGL